MVCWYCYWGWPAAVADIYEKYKAMVGDRALLYAQGHIVWADENFEDEQIRWCIEHSGDDRDHFSESEIVAVRQSLLELLAIPEDERCIEPGDYDGEHPERYHPAVPTRRVR